MSARGYEPDLPSGSRDTSVCQRLREDVAVAVLTRSPLPQDLEAHAAACPPCHDEFAELAGLSPLLAAVTDKPLDVVRPSDLLLPRLLAEVSRRRRRRQWISLASAAAVIAVAVPIGMALGRGEGDDVAVSLRTPTGSAAAAEPSANGASAIAAVYSAGEATDPKTGAEVEVEVRSTAGWGSAVTVKVKDVPPGTQCRLVVVDNAGNRIESGSWTVPPQGYKDYQSFPATVKTPPKRVTSVELVDDTTNKTIVRVPLVKA